MPSPDALGPGPYELLHRLAVGGMGEVYVARKCGSGAFEKRVALKLLLPHLCEQEEFVQMFLDEARLAARMNHPNVVQVFDLGQAKGRYFIAMALVEGVSLAQVLKYARAHKEPLPLPLLRLIAMGLCEGLGYVHDLCGPDGAPLHLIHRDVNPVNVLISVSGAVTLTDFGIAKARGALHTTRPGMMLGKTAYMAPEQLDERAVTDHRVDLYAAALTLYEAVTLTSPFRRESDLHTVEAVRSGLIPPARDQRADLTDGMAAALERGLARAPEQRFAHARELLAGLVDGPVARPSELGAWVRARFAGELQRFSGTEDRPTARLMETRSLLRPESSARAQATGRRPAPLRRAALGLLGAGLCAAAGWALKGRTEPEGPARPGPHMAPAPAAVARAPVSAPPAAPRTERAPATRAPPPVRTAVAEPRPARLRVGFLSADALPWAALLVDGHEVDRTPISRYPLPVGMHLLTFRNPDLRKEVHRRVVIREGRVERLRVELTP